MITKKEDLIGTIFNIADCEGGANVRLAGMFYDVCTKYNIRVMGGNGRDYFMKALGEGLVNLCIADDCGLGAFGRVSVSKDSTFGSANYSMSDFRHIDEKELSSHLSSELASQTKEVEWVNGDECIWGGVDAVFIGYSQSHGSRCAIEYLRGNCSIIDTVFIDALSKPETEAERIEREELENGEALFNFSEESAEKAGGIVLSTPWEDQTQASKDYWVMFAKQLGYRKESE